MAAASSESQESIMRPNKGLVLTVHLCRLAAGTAPRSTSPGRWAVPQGHVMETSLRTSARLQHGC
jgi:hypothetical protein